jgi:hypothetical protein
MDSKNLKAMKKNYIAPTIKVLHMNAVVILAGSTTGTSVYGDRSATPEYDCLAKRHSIWDEDVIKEE